MGEKFPTGAEIVERVNRMVSDAMDQLKRELVKRDAEKDKEKEKESDLCGARIGDICCDRPTGHPGRHTCRLEDGRAANWASTIDKGSKQVPPVDLRIVRRKVKVRDPSKPARYGGPPALLSKNRDTLQMRVDGEWQDVPIVTQEDLRDDAAY